MHKIVLQHPEGQMTEARKRKLNLTGFPVFKNFHESKSFENHLEYSVPSDIHMFWESDFIDSHPTSLSFALVGNKTPPNLTEYANAVKKVVFYKHIYSMKAALDAVRQLKNCESVEFHLGKKDDQLPLYADYDGLTKKEAEKYLNPSVKSVIIKTICTDLDSNVRNETLQEIVFSQVEILLKDALSTSWPNVNKVCLELPMIGKYLDLTSKCRLTWNQLKDKYEVGVRNSKVLLVPNTSPSNEIPEKVLKRKASEEKGDQSQPPKVPRSPTVTNKVNDDMESHKVNQPSAKSLPQTISSDVNSFSIHSPSTPVNQNIARNLDKANLKNRPDIPLELPKLNKESNNPNISREVPDPKLQTFTSKSSMKKREKISLPTNASNTKQPSNEGISHGIHGKNNKSSTTAAANPSNNRVHFAVPEKETRIIIDGGKHERNDLKDCDKSSKDEVHNGITGDIKYANCLGISRPATKIASELAKTASSGAMSASKEPSNAHKNSLDLNPNINGHNHFSVPNKTSNPETPAENYSNPIESLFTRRTDYPEEAPQRDLSKPSSLHPSPRTFRDARERIENFRKRGMKQQGVKKTTKWDSPLQNDQPPEPIVLAHRSYQNAEARRKVDPDCCIVLRTVAESITGLQLAQVYLKCLMPDWNGGFQDIRIGRIREDKLPRPLKIVLDSPSDVDKAMESFDGKSVKGFFSHGRKLAIFRYRPELDGGGPHAKSNANRRSQEY